VERTSGWLQAVAALLGLACAALLTWWTIVAFVGGQLWPLPIEVEGGLGFGLLWLFVIDPLAVTVLYGISVLVLAPLAGVAAWRDRRR
jgi:hypothetical protein